MTDLAQYGALGLVASTLLGLFAIVLRTMLRAFERQITRAGEVTEKQIVAMTAIAERLNGVHESVVAVDERVRDHHAFATAEARKQEVAHVEIAALVRALGREP